jgi:hypothetical protein
MRVVWLRCELTFVDVIGAAVWACEPHRNGRLQSLNLVDGVRVGDRVYRLAAAVERASGFDVEAHFPPPFSAARALETVR